IRTHRERLMLGCGYLNCCAGLHYRPSRIAVGGRPTATATRSSSITRRTWLRGAASAGLALALPAVNGTARGEQPAAAPAPEFVVQTATERQILNNISRGMTVFRFADDARILVIDFASPSEEGRTLNRVLGLAETAGAPRDRLLTDTETKAVTAFVDRVYY